MFGFRTKLLHMSIPDLVPKSLGMSNQSWGCLSVFCWCQLLGEFMPMHFLLPCSAGVCLKTFWCRLFCYLILLRSFIVNLVHGWWHISHALVVLPLCRRESPDAVPNSEWSRHIEAANMNLRIRVRFSMTFYVTNVEFMWFIVRV